MQEATELIRKANEELNRLSDILSDDIRNEDFEKVNLIYFLAAQLNVAASQLTGEAKNYEGACIVENGRAEVVINGFAVRGKETTFILTDDYKGRVTLPLVMDN